MSTFKWCEKSTALAAKLHAENMAKDHAVANSNAALKAIGETVKAELKHTGKEISAQSVRSKLAAEKVYEALTATPTKSKKGVVVTKADLTERIRTIFGIEQPIDTLENANRAALEALIEAAQRLPTLANASPQEKVEAAENLEDAEIGALDAGISPRNIAKVEDQAIADEVAAMQAESENSDF
jgi:phosphoenolpyruvate carboxylase